MELKYPHITVTSGMSGYFAVLVDRDETGLVEPVETGRSRYQLQADAIEEAQEWAHLEELPYVAP